ncbi:glycosyltransferase family 4 protein [Nitrosovibrio sp. Nv17]|jgi:glycosyltransferase involved in cell wall biosynthesis|uniref:glycosyltransferase family 4 protein n=1 Tax=Nitrosovibrio sp. Nv17 TaxID=1855339 RepID=UPI000908DA1A|nr:glycosyltransferase family 4 protein [Nitrosovibrio sp. Nv17]SFW16255.1 Glycosyltransferase involved in cell wall bisynthesis [Nitrosovibrio sp. Nv17]
MRVCFVSHSAGRYGAERALLELLRGLLESDVAILVLVPQRGPLLDELDQLGIAWRIIDYPPWVSRPKWFLHRWLRLLKMAFSSIQVARVIRCWDADIVYTNTVVTGTGAFGAWLARRPHVWHSHESLRHNPSQIFYLGEHAVIRLMDRLSVAIVVTSRSVADDYEGGFHPAKMHVVYQSVTLAPPQVQLAGASVEETPSFRCLVVGSLHPWKCQDQAISAVARLAGAGIDTRLLLVGGDGRRYRAQLQRQAWELGVAQRVEFRDYMANPMPLLSSADVVLVCSRWEAFGRVAVEAMLAGKAVIGSNRGATPEIIRHGETGLIYEWGDVGDLAAKIRFLYDYPEERGRIGQAGRRWAESRFTQARYAQEIFAILSAAASIRPRGEAGGMAPLPAEPGLTDTDARPQAPN